MRRRLPSFCTLVAFTSGAACILGLGLRLTIRDALTPLAVLYYALPLPGNGYAATWPVPAPMLALDQIWANDRVSFHVCNHLWSTRSDHRPVRATVSFR